MNERWLRMLTIVNTVVLTAVTMAAFREGGRERLTVLDVERINVVDTAGATRLVITSPTRSPGIIERGREITEGGNRTGLLFYNDEHTEAGGLIFSGRMEDGQPAAVGSLTFDQYQRDQAVALQYVDANGTHRAGLAVADYAGSESTGQLLERRRAIAALPAGPEKAAAQRELQELARGRLRLYAGRSRDDGASLISLHDASGQVRLQLRVDTLGAAVIEFLNRDGSVARTITP